MTFLLRIHFLTPEKGMKVWSKDAELAKCPNKLTFFTHFQWPFEALSLRNTHPEANFLRFKSRMTFAFMSVTLKNSENKKCSPTFFVMIFCSIYISFIICADKIACDNLVKTDLFPPHLHCSWWDCQFFQLILTILGSLKVSVALLEQPFAYSHSTIKNYTE